MSTYYGVLGKIVDAIHAKNTELVTFLMTANRTSAADWYRQAIYFNDLALLRALRANKIVPGKSELLFALAMERVNALCIMWKITPLRLRQELHDDLSKTNDTKYLFYVIRAEAELGDETC